jgi:hypothetical protein
MESLEPIKPEEIKTFLYDTQEEFVEGMINIIKTFKKNKKFKVIFVSSYTTNQYVLQVIIFKNSDKNILWIKEKLFSLN